MSRKRGHHKMVTTLSNLGFVDGHRQKNVHEHDPILVAILVARASPLDSEFNLPADWNANLRMGVQPSAVVVGADGAVVGNITGQAATDLPSPTVLGQALR